MARTATATARLPRQAKPKGPAEAMVDYRKVKGSEKLRLLVHMRQALAKERDRLQEEMDGKSAAILAICQKARVGAVNVEDEWAVRVSKRRGEKLDEQKLLKAGVSAKVIAACKTPWEGEPFIEVRGIGKKDKGTDDARD